MLKGKWKLLICIALVTCVIFTASNSVFAAINEEYYENNVVGNQPVDFDLDTKLSESTLVEAISKFIYAIGSLIEKFVGKVFQLITGSNLFPWADAILFNAIPFLDANIFTPASYSLISIIYDFLTGMYYSLLTLASTFFGIAVMFSAVKLAITAIAEDKARYKKAIVDWLLGLVMLWGIHFFVSFVLYLNEQFVLIASNIAGSEIEKYGSDLFNSANSDADAPERVEVFIKTMTQVSASFNINYASREHEGLEYDFGVEFHDYTKKYGENLEGTGMYWDSHTAAAVNVIRMYPVIASRLVNSDAFQSYVFRHNTRENKKGLQLASARGCSYVKALALHTENIVNLTDTQLETITKKISELSAKSGKSEEEKKYLNYLILMNSVYQSYIGNSPTEHGFTANLANYFKEAAWTRSDNSWKADTISVSNAIMYVIFVCYSVVFFISYTKRLFYVVILTLMAPIVVVFDFFMKFGK